MTTSESGATAGQHAVRGSSAVGELIERIVSNVGARASVSAVYGEPIDRDGVTVVPVARISFGFGAGAGAEQRESQAGHRGGGGGGATAVPIGYIEIKNGSAEFKRVLNPLIDIALPLTAAVLGAGVPRAVRRVLRHRSGKGVAPELRRL